jgi:hypothetical protein
VLVEVESGLIEVMRGLVEAVGVFVEAKRVPLEALGLLKRQKRVWRGLDRSWYWIISWYRESVAEAKEVSVKNAEAVRMLVEPVRMLVEAVRVPKEPWEIG